MNGPCPRDRLLGALAPHLVEVAIGSGYQFDGSVGVFGEGGDAGADGRRRSVAGPRGPEVVPGAGNDAGG